MLVEGIAKKVSIIFDVNVTGDDLIEVLKDNEDTKTVSIIKELEDERQKLKDKTKDELVRLQIEFGARADLMAQEDSPFATISGFYCSTIANEAMALIEGYK